MYKIFSSLFAFFILFLGTLSANSLFNPTSFDPEDSNQFSITFKTFKPSRIYGVVNSDPSAQNANKMDYGFGVSVNFLNFEYSPIFDNGDRYTLFYTFAYKSPVNPYIGFSYIDNTKIYDKATKSKIDGFDALVGIEVSYLKYVVPYFEYMPSSSLWMFGVRIKLGVIVDKKNAPKLDANQQANTPAGSNQNNQAAQDNTTNTQTSANTNQTTANQGGMSASQNTSRAQASPSSRSTN